MQGRLIYSSIDWSPKFVTWLNMIIGCSSKSIWVTRLIFCQNDSPMRGSFWQKDSFITYILFELQPVIIFSPVVNFGDQSLSTYLIYFSVFFISYIFYFFAAWTENFPFNWLIPFDATCTNSEQNVSKKHKFVSLLHSFLSWLHILSDVIIQLKRKFTV